MKLIRLDVSAVIFTAVFGVVISTGCSGCAQRAAPALQAAGITEQQRIDFGRHELVLGSGRQTVLTGFLLNGALADLAVVHVNAEGDRQLDVHGFGSTTWEPKLTALLRSGVLFVDMIRIDGRDRLISYEPGRLNWFDPTSSQEHLLVEVASSFAPPRSEEIPHVDLSRDLNRDGRDDLVVPAVDGFWVLVQKNDGSFADAVQIGPPTDLSGIYGADGYRYDPWSHSRVHEIDYNQDGRYDLTSWAGDHFAVHLQDPDGQYSSAVETFTAEVSFDSDDRYSLAAGKMTGRVLHSLTDLNGDAVSDLVIYSLEGSKLSKKESKYEVHLGSAPADGETRFSPQADFTLHSDRWIQLGMDRHDFDRDGQADLMLTTIRRDSLKGSLWKSLKGFMGDDIGLNIEFYRQENGRYSATPNATRVLALDGIPSHREPGSVPLDLVLRGATHERRRTQKIWPKAFNSILLIGDINGDGLEDFIKGDHPRKLVVHLGTTGAAMFAAKSQEIRVQVPNDEEYSWLVDLNQDGKQDLVLHQPFTDRDGHGTPKQPAGSEPHRVMLLIAQ
jgi:hypothetical protein